LNCIAVIPCFNEAGSIGRVVAETKNFIQRVLVIDDGSTDATAQNASAAGADVLRLGKNSGKGAALRAGWIRARGLGFSRVLMLDGDGQHDPAEIPKFLECVETTGASLVIGNRMEDTAAMPWTRRVVNRWMSRRLSRWAGSDWPDSQCGFRLARLEPLLRLALRAGRFEIESEMLVGFFKAGETIEFVPVRTIYNKSAVSKISPVTDTWRWFRWTLAQRDAFRACKMIRVP